MRYEDWDVILFPVGRDAKIPFKEFKTACHAIPDAELAHIHGSVGLPVMTCFVPSLPAGTPFQISIHSWRIPKISQFARGYSKHLEDLKFEARILLDGQLVASTTFERTISVPHLIATTFEFTKTGELERLRFPSFRRELLHQNHWNPGDDIGRIKIVISEGFPRDSASLPIERVKNVVMFSFQHAPLDILESNGIAWPNPSMWRRSPFNPAMPVPTFQPEDGPNSHSHSPRRRLGATDISRTQIPSMPLFNGGILPPQAAMSAFGGHQFSMPFVPRNSTGTGSSLSFPDPFSESAYSDWVGSMCNTQWLGDNQFGKAVWFGPSRSGRQSNSDTSMPDYVPGQVCEPMHISGPSLEDDPLGLKVPTNTPTTGPTEDFQGTSFQLSSCGIPAGLGASLTHSLLNQPMPFQLQPQNIPLPSSDVKSRKENRHLNLAGSNPASTHSTPYVTPQEMRKFSHPILSLNSNLGLTIDTSYVDSNPNALSTSPPAVFSASVAGVSPGGEFGTSITNLNTGKNSPPSPTIKIHPCTSETGVNGSPNTFAQSTGCCSGANRGRDFSPMSLKVLED